LAETRLHSARDAAGKYLSIADGAKRARDAALADVARLKAELDEVRGKALEEAIGAAMSLADSTACHPAARRSLEVLCGRLRALAAPAAKGGA
jgi:hypothetical protein